ncbi:PREDICTED: uncharacterized protein LOC106321268, partial [Brassica oleracea var. oleracea]|uniref:uncharacterized protein LOC106321268 n=1 Tax=Brassica oleracea var. oleracea TaxID=109376 RepID=UPI0006A729FB
RETAKWGSGSSAKSGVVSTPSSKGASHQKLITHFEGGIETNLNREKTRSNVAQTKREPAETRPQEQQEKLDDVGNHLEDFKSPNEGLEAKHSDLKGSTEKQRTSHQKLIAHSEGGIETNLDSATKRINEDFLEKKGDYSTFIHPSMAPSILLVSSLLCHSQHGARGFSSSSSGGDDDYQIYEPLSDAEITPKSILFKGCDYRHWLILMEFPKPLPPHDMIYQYESTCGKGLGISLRNARKRIYACSTSTYTGFQAEMKEEESEKFKSLPGVVFVLPDSYLDEDKKEYGGDRYEEGDITPRRRMKFKAGTDVWNPQWDAHLFEQQEKLDDVGNHLEDFKSPNEGLEAKHSDLKGSTEKQRTSHQKLIAHSEGGIETNLDSATKRINEDFLEKKGDYSTFIHPSMAPSILLVSSLLCHSQHGARGFSSSSSGGDDDYQIYEPLSDAEITPKSILFKGCDYRHWLILMEFPKPLPPHDMIYQYESTCGKGLGISLRNARKRIYACSTSTYTGFQAEMKEEESEKFKSLPGVVFVLPDSYLDEDKKEYGGDRYEEGDITPRRRMKFKAGTDVWNPQWDAHLFGGGAKKMLTRQEIIDRTSPGDDPRPLLAMQDILEDLLELRKKSEVTSGDFARQLHGRAATIDLFSIEGPICQEVVEKLEKLYGFWGSGDAEDKRSTPREDYRERFKGDRRFRGI